MISAKIFSIPQETNKNVMFCQNIHLWGFLPDENPEKKIWDLRSTLTKALSN